MSGWRKRQVMEMALEADIKFKTDVFRSDFCDGVYEDDLERFAELIREEATAEANARANASWAMMCEKMVAIEREACAMVCEEEQGYKTAFCALKIRARGQA